MAGTLSLSWKKMMKRSAVSVSHDTKALDSRGSTFHRFFACLRKKIHKKFTILASNDFSLRVNFWYQWNIPQLSNVIQNGGCFRDSHLKPHGQIAHELLSWRARAQESYKTSVATFEKEICIECNSSSYVKLIQLNPTDFKGPTNFICCRWNSDRANIWNERW